MRIPAKFDVSWLLAITAIVCVSSAQAQTSCGTQHRAPGAYICFPESSRALPASFHLSAQGNAAAGQKITDYQVAIDNQVVYQEREPNPVGELSIEITIKGPMSQGLHTLRLTITGAGSVEVSGLRFGEVTDEIAPCDPLSKSPNWACVAGAPHGQEGSPFHVHPESAEDKNLPSAFLAYRDSYQRTWKNLEFGTAEAFALDRAGNIYVASHSLADITVRKYDPHASRLLYSDVIRACSAGFTAITALVVDDSEHAWVSGYTNACLPTTASAYQKQITTGTNHGFVARLKTDNNGSPEFLTYVGGRDEDRIMRIRVNADGDIVLVGVTASDRFPHNFSFAMNASNNVADTNVSFVALLEPTGSKLMWSTLLQGAAVNALAIDGAREICVAGQSSGHALVAKLAHDGSRLIYSRTFTGNGVDRGSEISVDQANGRIYVTGETSSTGFLAEAKSHVSASAMSHRPGTPAEFLLELTPEGKLIQSANLKASEKGLVAIGGAMLDAFVAEQTPGTKLTQK